ncbi:MAG: class F sortase [Dehalococcoidia bacterium]|nr:class F sortase [Dehalococcoidia bacterium]
MRRLRRLPRWAVPPAGLAVLAVCAFLVWVVAFNGGDDSGSGFEQAIAAPTETASPTPVADIERLIIPAIRVDAPVTPKAVDRDGRMPSPDGPQDVIWYDFSALPGLGGRPGAGGNTILAGHVDYHGYGPAVFWDLRNVKQGDEITVRLRDGSEYKYTARSNRIVDPAAASFNEIVASTTEESLTVITCAGDFDPATRNYDMRRVVWAVRVG